ncbi:MAG TPA: hypothetical protein VD966_10925 [Pyrinomonadaceae bacterium]|nr:hypothetical protein [Pyrinomonadaceae bacterium]
MIEPDRTDNEQARVDSTGGGVGDVETAGETTAAAVISGPTDTRPVGADTMVKVADTPDEAERENE